MHCLHWSDIFLFKVSDGCTSLLFSFESVHEFLRLCINFTCIHANLIVLFKVSDKYECLERVAEFKLLSVFALICFTPSDVV